MQSLGYTNSGMVKLTTQDVYKMITDYIRNGTAYTQHYI